MKKNLSISLATVLFMAETILSSASQNQFDGSTLGTSFGITYRVFSDEQFTNSLGMTFKLIPPGTFMMGSPEDEQNRYPNETQHQVTLTQSYYIQTTEVTQGQWRAVMGKNPSYFSNFGCGGDDCPVEQVSWNDIQAFIAKLNQNGDGRIYRLPTEAEWEYAARAGTTTPFNTGNCLSTYQANYDGYYPYQQCHQGADIDKTLPAASFSPNDWGLYDMHGNVFEWCQDFYANYSPDMVIDPVGALIGSERVIRGGCWRYYAHVCRSAFRFKADPYFLGIEVGFRLACSAGYQ